MVTLETGTHPPETRTTTDQVTYARMPIVLTHPPVIATGELFERISGPEFLRYLQSYIGRVRRQTDFAEWLAVLEPHGPSVQRSGLTGSYRNAERQALKREVHALLNEACEEDWDGEGALALDTGTVAIAMALVDTFPPHVARPEVAATPHGEVDFDWVIDSETMLTISVSPSKDIAFAGLFRGGRLNGSEPWNGVLPHFVDCCFERLREVQSA